MKVIELKKEANESCVCTTLPMRETYVTGYLNGAEPREKRIEELEEINADLKQSLDWANEREHDDYVKIQSLEKENAELKEHIENIYANHCGNCNRNILNTSLKKEITDLRNNMRSLYD